MQGTAILLSGTEEAEGVRELSSSVSAVVVAHSVTLLTVWLVSYAANKQRLVVYRSPIVSTAGELFYPVAGFLRLCCHVLDKDSEADDEGMMWGKGITEEYDLFAECPGSSVQHSCFHK